MDFRRAIIPQWFLIAATLMTLLSEQVRSQDAQPTKASAADARTDSFETKLKLLEAAWQQGDLDLARSLTHSLRDTVLKTQLEKEAPGKPLIETKTLETVESLPPAWQKWAKGWKYFKEVVIEEFAGEPRSSEPVEELLSFPANQVASLARELRVARIVDGDLVEVPSQMFHERRRGEERSCRVLWMADSSARQKQSFLVFYGNPDAELPQYTSDLSIEGEGYGLDISNAHFKASLSRQTGQLERLTLRREHGLEIFSGGQGHGEPPGIDWAHDYVDKDNFQKLRISLWDRCPDYEVIRGPVCTIVRRWGFPRSPIYPIDSPARLNVSVEYRFYAGLPWFHKIGAMKAVQAFDATALRDDEWVFSGMSFTDPLWINRAGKVNIGAVTPGQEEDLWGVGFFNRSTRDSFVALFLEHAAEGLPELKHTGSPQMYYRWHGSVWSRYPLPVKSVPKGAVLRQKNAYVSIPFTAAEGPTEIERLRRCLVQPLVASAGSGKVLGGTEPTDNSHSVSTTARLARPGENGDGPIAKRVIWDALRDCKDGQLYTADINVVDLGLVNDVRVRGDVVTLVMSMPHRGRPMLGYFGDGSISVHPTLSLPVRERIMKIPGVRHVVFEQTWEPGWSANNLTDEGRKRLGLD